MKKDTIIEWEEKFGGIVLVPTVPTLPSQREVLSFPLNPVMQIQSYAIDNALRNLIETYGYNAVMDSLIKRFS